MSCGCENKKIASERERIAELAKKCAVMEQCIMELRLKDDGTYTFNRVGIEGYGKIIEYIHYL